MPTARTPASSNSRRSAISSVQDEAMIPAMCEAFDRRARGGSEEAVRAYLREAFPEDEDYIARLVEIADPAY
jgi:hypothetical protein